MAIFKPADPTKRRPAYLQGHTKENFIWQLKLLVIYILASELYEWYRDRQLSKKWNREHPNPK